MNILFLLKSLDIGGVEIVTKTLGNEFIKHGHSVSIFAFDPPKNTIENLIDRRIKVYTKKSLTYSIENINSLRQVFIADKINIVINQWGLPFLPIKIAIKAAKGLNIKFISIYHNAPDANGKLSDCDIQINKAHSISKLFLKGRRFIVKQITSQSMRYVYNRSDLYMVLSPSFIDKFKDFTGIKHPDHLTVQTNPVTIDAADYIFSPDKKRKEVIYMGRIDYNQKRVCRLIDTWAILEKQFPDWQLTIVGDGPERKNVEKQAQDLNLQHISFEGFQHPRPYYEHASVLALTSEYEGFPLVLAEGMSFGVVPVVYGSYSAVYDIIRQNENGIIVQPQNGKFDVNEMAKALAFIMENEPQRNEMARNAMVTSERDYSLESIYRSWKKVFDKLMQ